MASTVNFSLFTALIIVFIQSVTSGSLYELAVERSSVNPLSYTEEIRYSRDRTTQRPVFDFFRRRLSCPENEHFARCDANCQKTCDNYKGQNRCPRACIWGCVCNTGFVRGPDNKCIEPKDCPAKPNAETQHLYVTLNPPPYTDDDYHIPSSGTKSPEKSDSETENPQFEETEIPPISHLKSSYKCPGSQSIWEPCTAHCQRTCSNKDDKNFKCRPFCVPGCICEPGLVLGPESMCIEEEKCPPESYSEKNSYVTLNPPPYTDDDYHIPSSGTKSPLYSETDNPQFEETDITSKSHTNSYVTLNPPPYTDDDYHIPSSGTKSPLDSETDNPQFEETDIPSKSHTSIYATLNPTYYTDADYHNSETRTRKPPVSATENPQYDETEIPPITQTKPPHDCPPSERYVPCGRHCQRNCSNKDDTDFRCKPICEPGCICEIGLVKGPDGKCIEKDKCPDKLNVEQEPSLKCPPRERYVPCGGHCQRNCTNKDDEEFDCRPVCIPGCVCEEGLVRGSDGKCIEKDKCPNNLNVEQEPSHKCPPRELYVPCGGHCQRNCSNKDDEDFDCRPVCIPGCICEEGLVKGPDGKCIEKDKCQNNSDSERVLENNRLNTSPNSGCPNDSECTLSCRNYGHMYGHCTGRNNHVCSCLLENYENAENEEFQISANPCPDDYTCRKMCRMTEEMKGGQCVGPNMNTCICY